MPLSRLTDRTGRGWSKRFSVAVSTMDADLKFDDIEHKATGQELFELICRTLGLRETWFFGLKFVDSTGDQIWLRLDKRIVDQDVPCRDGPRSFQFLVKFYPEDVQVELIQEMTQHLFYLQIKQSILHMDIYCPPEATVLLASFALQAKYGDYDETVFRPEMLSTEDLLPQRVLDHYQMSPDTWADKIREWYASSRGLSREDAEMEYMKIAQRLEMYAVNYFKIKNKKGTDLWLGVSTMGLNVYELDNRLHHTVAFKWSEIRNVAYNDRRFIIKLLDRKSSDLTFLSPTTKVNKLILELCEGNHSLFMKRRKPESVEVQQMRVQGREERARRQMERAQLQREKELREQAEREREEAERKLRELQEEYSQTREALECSEKAADLLAEKVQIAEEERTLLNRKAAEAEAEKQRLHRAAIEKEEEKLITEMRAREAERIANRIVEECEQRTKEAQQLKAELAAARLAEKAARERYEELMRGNIYRDFGALNYRPGDPDLMTSDLLRAKSVQRTSPMTTGLTDGGGGYDVIPSADVDTLSREIERERVEYLERNKNFQEQLKGLKSEVEVLKSVSSADNGKQCQQTTPHSTHRTSLQQLDRIAAAAPQCSAAAAVSVNGNGSLISMLMAPGTAKSRVQFYENL